MSHIFCPSKYLQAMNIFGSFGLPFGNPFHGYTNYLFWKSNDDVVIEDIGVTITIPEIKIPEITTNSYNVVDNSRSISIGPDVKIGGTVSLLKGEPSKSFGTALRELWTGITMPVKAVVNTIPKPVLAIIILALGLQTCLFVRRNKYETRIYDFIRDYPGWSIVIGCFVFMAGKSTVKFLLM
jgi:hypothetical protein